MDQQMTPVQRKVEATRRAAQKRRADAMAAKARMAGTPRINIYTCAKCDAGTVTVDVDDGVTPFIILCRATERCGGEAHSCFYRVPPGDHVPTFEWYKPTIRKAKRLDRKWPGTLDHVRQGGLMLRPRTDAEPVLHKKPE